MSEFIVYPAIDLRGGKVVRLIQGNPQAQKEYSGQPAEVARRWASTGARWLHVVNLDGAFEQGGRENWAALLSILTCLAENAPQTGVQYGGGLRTLEAVERAFQAGVQRVILGTAAIESPALISHILQTHGSQALAIALDVIGGKIHLRGWRQATNLDATLMARRLADMGVSTLIHTDIQRDGTGAGLNLSAAHQLAQSSGLTVIASGGINSLEDVRQARQFGLGGVIIGRALYDGKIHLEEALAC